jgi:ABC-type sugar transport system substrate-binding protein
MPTGRFVLSLITTDNDYQKQQAASAQEVANRLGFELDIIFAENDSIMQSQQLLSTIQSSGPKPDGIAFEPVSGTGLPQVAKAAVAAKIGWAVVNRSVDYVSALRAHSSVPVFQVSADHVEVGRIQGRQMRALLPQGGLVLYIQGPTSVTAAEDRTRGLSETKPENIQLRVIKGSWTQESAYAAVSAWMRLSTSHTLPVSAIVAQNDTMAIGARRAFEESTSGAERERWLGLPFLGCDGLPETGRAWVHRGLLAATITLPETAGVALEMLANAQRTGKVMPEMTLVAPASYPPIGEISGKRSKNAF